MATAMNMHGRIIATQITSVRKRGERADRCVGVDSEIDDDTEEIVLLNDSLVCKDMFGEVVRGVLEENPAEVGLIGPKTSED